MLHTKRPSVSAPSGHVTALLIKGGYATSFSLPAKSKSINTTRFNLTFHKTCSSRNLHERISCHTNAFVWSQLWRKAFKCTKLVNFFAVLGRNIHDNFLFIFLFSQRKHLGGGCTIYVCGILVWELGLIKSHFTSSRTKPMKLFQSNFQRS
ncbi:unnamed protein product [Albugo candida]|uniref:Uncharacterized protein n=1 Tax=Albugo candida TaxID=65357 RepID=A0A024G671_9STRA|nr:unnamed protein product [Albugo candida]|eukprot:CCI42168.1 unnamed protein product [Albugo candida]